MTDQPTLRPMTPNQLRAVVYQIARTYLEVERGLRAPDQLAAFLTRAEYRRHRVTGRGQRAASRPVRPTDIGKVRLDAAAPDRVNASVLVRRDDDRWSSLLVDLKQTGHGWQVERLDRLERLIPREPRQVEIDEHAIERRRRFVEGQLQVVDAAHRLLARRYDRIADKRTREARMVRPELDRWVKAKEDLTVEAALLQRQAIGRSGAVATPTTSLGGEGRDLEEGGSHLECQDFVSREVSAYRRRWGLSEEQSVLEQPGSDEQAADRRDLLLRLRASVTRAVGGEELARESGALAMSPPQLGP